jgi:tetratricopeptide (TPR) repeat protein
MNKGSFSVLAGRRNCQGQQMKGETSMTKQKSRRAPGADPIDRLYQRLLFWLYEKGNPRKAGPLADRLERELAKAAEKSIRVEECRALIAEARGDLRKAIKHREKEIALIRKLHRISLKRPGEAYVFAQYSYADLSDRMNLLAVLYHDIGNLKRALELLHKSKKLCTRHAIAFDSTELIAEYSGEKAGMANAAQSA